MITPNQDERLKTIPSKMKGIFNKCYLKKASKTEAIKAKCYDCCCYQRDEVYNCTTEGCPLFQYRPTPKFGMACPQCGSMNEVERKNGKTLCYTCSSCSNVYDKILKKSNCDRIHGSLLV